MAGGCLRALSNEYRLTVDEAAIHEMTSLLGVCIPHYVQMFFDHVYQASRLQGTHHVSREMVTEVYKHSMLGTRGHAELSHLEERLRMILGPRSDLLALDLLTEAAVTGSLAPQAAETLSKEHFDEAWQSNLREVLSVLEHDGYLDSRSGSYEFVSRLLKDWWKARFEFAYVPVAKRGGAKS